MVGEEFEGKLNIAFQFFPLQAACNDVVETDKHPGACEMSYMLAADPEHLPEWRADFAHGIRSTPTMIISNRMVIGTLPYEQLQAIFHALLDEYERGGDTFMESWIDS